jgi:hypothetical protein
VSGVVTAGGAGPGDAGGAWSRFWFGPLDPLPAALFRIALGAVLLLLFVARGADWDRLYGPAGILPLDDPALATNLRVHVSLFAVADGVVPVATFWWVGVLAAAILTLGLWSRLAAAVLFVLLSSMLFRLPVAVSGEDWVLRIALLPSCFATLDTRLSLRAWWRRRRGRPAARPGPVWPIRLIQLHVVLIYLFTMANRLATDPAWWSGDAMYWVMTSSTWAAWPWPEAFYRPVLARTVTWGVLVAEGWFPLAVLWRPTRIVAAVALIAMHLTAAVVLRGVTFFTASMACPLLLFVDGAAWRRAASWVRAAPPSPIPRA